MCAQSRYGFRHAYLVRSRLGGGGGGGGGIKRGLSSPARS